MCAPGTTFRGPLYNPGNETDIIGCERAASRVCRLVRVAVMTQPALLASSSIIAGLKFWVVDRNSCIGTPSMRSRWDICADCHGSYLALRSR